MDARPNMQEKEREIEGERERKIKKEKGLLEDKRILA